MQAELYVLRFLPGGLVAPLNNADHLEALGFTSVEYDEALQFVTCRRVGAKYLVTRNDFGLKRTPVNRRTAGEMLPFVQSVRDDLRSTPKC